MIKKTSSQYYFKKSLEQEKKSDDMAEKFKKVELGVMKNVEFTVGGKNYVAVFPPNTKASDIVAAYKPPSGKPPAVSKKTGKVKDPEKLKEWRKKQGESNRELANAIGVTVYEVNKKGSWTKVKDPSDKVLAKAGRASLSKAKAIEATKSSISAFNKAMGTATASPFERPEKELPPEAKKALEALKEADKSLLASLVPKKKKKAA